jgi:hemolysin III
VLYDARRGVYYARPALRGWLHFLCFWVSVAGGALLLDRAGTATPVFLLSAPAGAGVVSLIVMWALTLAAMATRLAWPSAPELVAGALFIGLGCAGGLALPWVWIHGGSAAGVLIMVGGLLYIVGACSYHRRWPDPYPSVFGYHEIFHLYVCAAAACQYAAIARLIS